ncbi:squalene/phytoene synthase family protein [Actinoplanes sp. NPDC051411]|uniref:phytoene/squalene synthase family protein n=1 Tax=Actinoplanes sp. NPDC051411 TaxID=3155522 RepID=UPI00341BA022
MDQSVSTEDENVPPEENENEDAERADEPEEDQERSIADPRPYYRTCERLLRDDVPAIFHGLRLLPPGNRRALSVIYAVTRRIVRAAHSHRPVEERQAELDSIRMSLRQPPTDETDPVLAALADTAAKTPIPLAAFDEMIAAHRADVEESRIDDASDLLFYCHSTGGAIGRLALAVCGGEQTRTAWARADALGVALKLTEILRNLGTDRRRGRIYLPAEDLHRFGCTLELGRRGFLDPPGRLMSLIQFEAFRADWWYREGAGLVPMLDRRAAAYVAGLHALHHHLLRQIIADPLTVTSSHPSLPVRRRLWTTGRAVLRQSA